MDVLEAVKAELSKLGWDNGIQAGSVKRDTAGAIIATRGSVVFVHDMEKACDLAASRLALAELLHRRARQRR